MSTHTFYKGKYFICFYDMNDSFQFMFNNVREILKNIRLINVELYRALKSESHITKLLTGELMRVYIINTEDEDNE